MGSGYAKLILSQGLIDPGLTAAETSKLAQAMRRESDC
jgi:hypothetical protein